MLKFYFRIFIFTLVTFWQLFTSYCVATTNLSLFRPVTVSSTDHAPTPAEFATDGEYDTGWRAKPGALPQWIMIDLQAECLVESVNFFSEANFKTPLPILNGLFVRGNTFGHEIFSSYPIQFKVQSSLNGFTWQTQFSADSTKGGKVECTFQKPIYAKYIRVFIEKSSSVLPVSINELSVMGACNQVRPKMLGWTQRRKPKSEIKSLLTTSNPLCLPISTGWELTRSGWNNANNGTIISTPEFDTQNWYNATVPGSVVASLVEQEVFPEPAIGFNSLKIPESLCRHNWWYRRDFDIPDNFNLGTDRTCWLTLDGINFKANVWFNGKLVGTIPSAFVRAKFDVTAYINVKGENVIAIEIIPISTPGVPADKSEDGNAWVQSGNVTNDGASYLCSSGWDWMPAMRDRGMGILGDVNLVSTANVSILDPRIVTDLHLPDTTKAYLRFEIPVINTSSMPTETDVIAQFENIKLTKRITLQAHEEKIVVFATDQYKELIIGKPKLWWPNGYGRQYLYELAISTQVNNQTSDIKQLNFGIRKITYNTNELTKNRRGESNFKSIDARFVRINSSKSVNGFVSIFDFCVYNSANLLHDLAARKPIAASSYAPGWSRPENANDKFAVSKWVSEKSENQSIIVDLGKVEKIDRVVAGWDYEGLSTDYTVEVSTDSISWLVVDTCEQKPTPQLVLSVNGLPVFCKGGNWGLFDIALRMPDDKMKQALYFHKELGFTMIRNWMGNTMTPSFFKYCDEYGLLVMNDFWASLPKDEAAYVQVCTENIKRYRNHASLAMWAGANESYPPPFIDAGIKMAMRKHDPERLYVSHSADDLVAGFGPYFYTEPTNYYNMARGFKTEIGLATVPVVETIKKMVGDEPSWPMGLVWDFHDNRSNTNDQMKYLLAMEQRFGKVNSAEEYCAKGQYVNYENLRSIFEAWNNKLWNDCSAVILWMTHAAWYSTVWQLYDYDYEIGGAYFGAKKGAGKFHVQANLTDWKVSGLNYSARELKNISITAKIFSLNGIQIGKTQHSKINIAASAKTETFNLNIPPITDSLTFVKLEMRTSKGVLLADNFYCKYIRPQNMQLLNQIAKAKITSTLISKVETTEQTIITAKVKNNASTVAPMIVLSLLNANTNERILPTYYSDNYFWLLPSEEKIIRITFFNKQLKNIPTSIKVGGMYVENCIQ